MALYLPNTNRLLRIKKTINRFLTDIGYQQNMSGGRHLGTITIKTNIFIDKAASTHVIDFQATKVNEPRPRTGIKRKSTFVNI